MAILKRKSATSRKTTWQVLIDRRDAATGKRKRVTIGTFRTRKEAEKAERDALSLKDRGKLVDPSRTTVSDLLDSWLATKAASVSNNSISDYETAARLHLKPAFGSIYAQRLGPTDVQAQYDAWRDKYLTYQQELAEWRAATIRWQTLADEDRGKRPEKPTDKQGLSPRMIHRCHIVLSQALAQAVRFGILTHNVCTDVTKPSIQRPKPNVWSLEEASEFLEVAKSDALAPLWYLLALEGMRRGEALGLRWQDVTWKRGVAHISQTVIVDRSAGHPVIQPRTKTNSGSRAVKLTAETLAVLEEHRDRQRFQRQAAGGTWTDNDLIVCTSKGTPINPNNVTRSYNRLVLLSGVPRIRVHDIRHTAISLLLRAGVSMKVVQERAGHASISTTMDLYGHIGEDMQDQAAAAMSALFSAQDKIRKSE